MTSSEIIELLGLDSSTIPVHIKSEPEIMHQLKRKIRYLCYAMRTPKDYAYVEVPEKFIKYFESNSLFEGWAGFAITWDVKDDNPIQIYFRDFSLEQEWEAALRRVVPVAAIDRTNRRNK